MSAGVRFCPQQRKRGGQFIHTKKGSLLQKRRETARDSEGERRRVLAAQKKKEGKPVRGRGQRLVCGGKSFCFLVCNRGVEGIKEVR